MSDKSHSTTEQEYQRDYYKKNKVNRTKALKERWANDAAFRETERERNQKRRGQLRAEKAGWRFHAMIHERRKRLEPTRPPRWVLIGSGPAQQVWTTGSLGREVGRSGKAIRSWLREGVLPGATVYIGGSSFFSRRFCDAVYRACERLFYLDGRGDRLVLKRLVREELAKTNTGFVPPGGDNSEDRVVINNA